ncbi:hypothetical protein WG66_010983 [Moniliophthora roreri]|nr:hypothetical protein WG66_010983 [Moniliophthora roreri]
MLRFGNPQISIHLVRVSSRNVFGSRPPVIQKCIASQSATGRASVELQISDELDGDREAPKRLSSSSTMGQERRGHSDETESKNR